VVGIVGSGGSTSGGCCEQREGGSGCGRRGEKLTVGPRLAVSEKGERSGPAVASAGPWPKKRKRGRWDWALQAERRRERGEKEFHFSFSKTNF